MPRNNASTSTLRNRNRVTNKTRLKVFHGTIDADPLLLEDEEVSNDLKLNTQGVDAEDANVSLAVCSLFPPLQPCALVALTWHFRHAFRGMLTKHPFLVYRSTTFKLSYLLLLNAIRTAHKDSLGEQRTKPALSPLSSYLCQIQPVWSMTIQSSIPQIDGRIRQHTSVRQRRPMSVARAHSPMVLHITWMNGIRNGSIRTTRKPVGKARALKVLSQHREPRRDLDHHGARRLKARSRRSSSHSRFPRMTSSW
jgi:hypothetical protein